MAMTRSIKAALLTTVRTSRRPPWWRLVCVITNFKVSSIAPWWKGATSFGTFLPPSSIFRPPSPSPSRLWHQSPVKSRRVSRHDYHSKDLNLTITNSINACNVESLQPNSGVFQWCPIAQRNDEAIIRIKNLINDINSDVSINASSNIHCHYVRKYRYILWVTSIKKTTSTQNSIRRNTCYEYMIARNRCPRFNVNQISWRDKSVIT